MEHSLKFHGPSAVVLWKHDALTCTCLTHAPDRVEVRLVVTGVVIQREFFADTESASQFAIKKMHAYTTA